MRNEELIRGLCEEQSGEHAALAQAHGGLAVFADWTAVAVLQPDGAVLIVYLDEDKVSVGDTRTTLSVHGRAVELYPELADLLRDRPSEAPDCAECGGTGKIQVRPRKDAAFGLICSGCVGLGWVPDDLPPL